MANRTTVKSNIQTLNVPSVSNADMEDMLNDNICDNVRFIEDVATVQSSTVSNITCDFTGKDRIDLTRTGGSLNITFAGIGDGAVKDLLINKSAGQIVTFTGGIVDVTPVAADVTAAVRVLYEITRKNIYYYARAWVGIGEATTARAGVLETATLAEAKALTVLNKTITPGTIPMAAVIQMGISKIANETEIESNTDIDGLGRQLVVQPSELNRKINEIAQNQQAWQNPSYNSGWAGDTFGPTLQFRKNNVGQLEIYGGILRSTGGTSIFTLPVGYRPSKNIRIVQNAVSTTYIVDISISGLVSTVSTTGFNFFYFNNVFPLY